MLAVTILVVTEKCQFLLPRLWRKEKRERERVKTIRKVRSK